MLTATHPKSTKKTKREERVRFPGICADARALGVHRITLYRVLTGERSDLRGLRARFDAMKSGK